MNVPYFKTGPFTCQSTRSEGGKPSFVRYLREWIGLVHKLAQLARPEKLLHCSHDRFSINQVMRHCTFEFGQRHFLFDGTLHAHQPYPEMVFQEFSNTAYPPVAQMVDIVDFPPACSEIEKVAHNLDNVFVCQDSHIKRHIKAELLIDF